MTSLPEICSEFEAYDFSGDVDFKAGMPAVMSAIRGQKRSAAQIDEIIARAQWFYFCRLKGLDIPFDAYSATQHDRASLSGAPQPASESRKQAEDMPPGSAPDASAPQDMSFEMLAKLISEGRAGEIGNQRTIPDELNDQEPSASIMAARPKPWEIIQAQTETREKPLGLAAFDEREGAA